MRRIILGSFCLFSVFISNACDICGCGVGNFNPYMFPQLSHNFFSISWQHRYYQTHFYENGELINNREYYNTMTLAGQYSPVKNLQLMFVLPYQVNKQTGPEGIKSLNRIGDIFFLANYKVFDHLSKGMVRQSLLLGAGIKAPTGDHHFDENDNKDVGNSNFQAGTGSTDFLLNSYYSLRVKRFAFSMGANYKMNGTNKDGYHFGDRFQTVTQLKYIKDIKNISIIPSAGIETEHMSQDRQDGIVVDRDRTGGYNTQALLGIDLNSRKFAMGINYSFSISQQLAAGQINAKPSFALHLSYTL